MPPKAFCLAFGGMSLSMLTFKSVPCIIEFQVSARSDKVLLGHGNSLSIFRL